MIYCMSDLHGEEDRFHAMLEKIQFSDQDTLYIIGDVIDRSPGGVSMLQEIMAADNIHMLLGNHEQMCLDTLGPNSVYGSRDLWRHNGGNCTYRHLLYISSARERWEILRFIASLPDHLEVTVGNRVFHLVHGMPSEDPHRRIWDRPVPDCIAPFPDRTTIVGHTPTCFLTGRMDETLTIWHGDGIIDIDCGCGNPSEHRRLACLRLDDMAEFYV